MTLKILTGQKAPPFQPLRDRSIAVIGFGNQGHAHALNLRDSGANVVVGVRSNSDSARRAREAGLHVERVDDTVERSDLVIIAVPDEVQPAVWSDAIEPNLKPGATVGFLHGYCLRFDLIKPAKGIGVVMVAPKGPGDLLRARFVEGKGIPALFAVHQDSAHHDAEELGLAWASGIGCSRAAIVYTTIADETETDLFGEQAVLCGGMTELILAAFHTLIEAGYPPELAYMECCQEVKQVADLVYARGLAGMMKAISNTAEFGAYETGPCLIDDRLKARLKELLDDIRSGRFADRMQKDALSGFRWFDAQRERLASDAIEDAGLSVRAWMPWLDEHDSSAPADVKHDRAE